MALISNIGNVGAHNRIIEEGLKIVYSKTYLRNQFVQETAYGVGSTTYSAWEIRRVATMRLRYTGMTYPVALEKQYALIDFFTRKVRHSYWDSWTGMFNCESLSRVPEALMADVSVSHVAGNSYDVIVAVNEDTSRNDLVLPPGPITNIFDLFGASQDGENTWKYNPDGDDESEMRGTGN